MSQKLVAVHPETYDELFTLKLRRSLELQADLSFNDIIKELLDMRKNKEE